MADEHFFPGESFPSGLGAAAAPFFSSASYAPPGLDAAVMQGFGMAWAAELRQLPDSSASAVAAAHFDSALSSLVSSPAHNAGGDDAAVIGDLIGRLGSICNGAAAASASNSCYSTPVSSPPRAGAAASPAALAAFRGGGYPAGAAAIETVAGNGSLSRVSSSKSLGAGAAVTPGTASPDPAAETSAKVGGNAAADPTPPAKARKRKAAGKGKAAAATSAMQKTTQTAAAVAANASPKRSKVVEGGSAGEGKDDDDGEATAVAVAPEPEPAKDYIHVRARRGQATDSHSLAERVRRERISERMKMLQSLVPGCNKITGKALMLDEIINYVQSLQHQVEFLSMKLATMSPAELDADARYQPTAATMPPAAAAAFSSYATAAADLPPFATAAHPAHHHQLLDTTFFGWEAQDLQSVVVAAVHGHDVYASPAPHDGFHGQQQGPAAAGSHMKLELP